ncbi:MAG: oligopeptide/dipeptide ABC transporter ATP-binding protein [Promethearchaeota archaeon]
MFYQINNNFMVQWEISILIILYVAGTFITRWYAKERRWSSSLIKALIVQIPWLIFSFLSILSLFFPVNESLFIPFIKIAIIFIVGMIVVSMLYEKDLVAAALFIVLIQIILFVMVALFDLLYDLILIFIEIAQIESNQYFGGAIMYFISILVVLGFSIFSSYWGDKMQLVKRKKLIAIITIIPGFFIITYSYINQYVSFYSDFSLFLILSLLGVFFTLIIIKQIAYKSIPYHEIRKLVKLERGKKLLEVNDLEVHYPLLGGMLKRQIGAVKAVNGVNFYIKTGETLGLVGESGCGKTTVANAILGIVEKTSGEISFNDKPIPEEYPKDIRRKIQIVFQDPDASLNPRMKIADIIGEPLKNLLGITKKDEIRRYVLKLLEQVSLKREHMDRYPHEFSGGQKQRIIIARALASNPELIILDEPTSALDVSVQAQILNLLKDLQKTYGYGFLFITHNLSVANHIADRIAVMYLGKFVEIGKTDQIFQNPTHPYTQALLSSRSEIDVMNREITFVIQGEVPSPIAPPPGCTFNPRCVSDARTKECEHDLPHEIKIEEGHYIWCVNPPVGFIPPE